MKQIVDGDNEAAAVPLPPEAVENNPQNMEKDLGERPEVHQVVREPLEEVGVEGGREDHLNEEKLKEERLPQDFLQQERPDLDALGNDKKIRGEGERGDGRKREVEAELKREKEEEVGIDDVDGALDHQIAVAAAVNEEGEEVEEKEEEGEMKQEVKQKARGEEAEEPAGVEEGEERDGGRKARELKAMTNGS